MASYEKIGIKVGVEGVKESIDHLSRMEKATEKAIDNLERLDRLKANPLVTVRDKATSILEGIANKFISLGKTALHWGGRILGVLGGILGGMTIRDTYKAFAGYEQGLANVQAVLNATKEDMAPLGDLAKKIGEDMKIEWSMTDALGGMELLAQAGWDTQAIYRDIPDALNLATAGSMDLAQATDIAITTMNNFKKQGVTMKQVSDILSKGANAAAMDVSDMGEAMKYVGPVSSALGMTLEQTTGAIAALSNAGIKGSQAGTVLRASLTRLATQRGKAAEYMEKLGIAGFDAQGNLKPFPALIGEIAEKTKHLTAEGRAAALANIFGQEALAGITALVEQGAPELQRLTDEIMNAEGSAQAFADIKMDGVSQKIGNLAKAFDPLKVEVVEKLKPLLEEFLDWFIAKMPDIKTAVLDFTDSFVANVPQIVNTLKGVLDFVATFGPAIVAMLAVIKLGPIISMAGAMITLLTGVSTFLSWPIIAIAAIAAGIVLLITNFDKIAEVVGNVGAKLAEWAGQVIMIFANLLIGIFEFIGTVAAGLITGLGTAFGFVLTLLAQAGAALITGFAKWAVDAGTGMANLGNTIVTTIGGFVGQMVQAGANLIGGVIQGVKNKAGELIGMVKNLGGQVVGAFKGFFKIKSPSRIMAALGEFLPEGVAVGIEKKTSEPIERIRELRDRMTAKFTASGPSTQTKPPMPIAPSKPQGEGGGNSFNFGGIPISITQGVDVNGMIEEAKEAFGAQLLEALIGQV